MIVEPIFRQKFTAAIFTMIVICDRINFDVVDFASRMSLAIVFVHLRLKGKELVADGAMHFEVDRSS